MHKRKIQACLSPALLSYYDLSDTVAVVIDIFRATSSICYGLANGATAIIPVAEVEECLSYRQHGFLLAAERDGKVVDGFDFGNSPFSYTPELVKDKTVVLTTTNGTRAIQQCIEAQEIIIGSFGNIDVLCKWLSSTTQHVLLVCSGWKNHPCMEDTFFAGAVIDRIQSPDSVLDDGANMAQTLFKQGEKDPARYLKEASHTKRMQRLDIEKDIVFCLTPNTAPVIPVFRKGKLVVEA